MTVGELTRKTATSVNTILRTIVSAEDYFARNNYRIMRYADILDELRRMSC